MARKRTKVHALQLSVAMILRDVLQMPDREWNRIYGPTFKTRENAKAMAEISSQNRRPFIVVAISQEAWEGAKWMVREELTRCQ